MDDQPKENRRRGRWIVVVILAVLLLLASGVSVYLFAKYQQALKMNPDKERQQIIAFIEQTVALPQETPVLSTVADKSRLQNRTLKAKADNGDKLLIYAKAKRLIIYRPSTQKVIDMLTIQDKPASETGGAGLR